MNCVALAYSMYHSPKAALRFGENPGKGRAGVHVYSLARKRLLNCCPAVASLPSPVKMAHSTEQLSTEAHLPPQLANALGDAASSVVAEMCFMAPGTPWSAQLQDDLLADLCHGEMVATCDSGGTCIRAAIFGRTVKATRKQPRRDELVAYIQSKRSSDPVQVAYMSLDYAPEQPFDRAGLRKQIEWCQQKAHDILRRGYCDRCYDGKPRAKRLRVSGTQVCRHCLFERCLQPSSGGSGE